MNVSDHPWGALQIAMDDLMPGAKYACPNPNCRTVYGITEEELARDADMECGRCGWGPMVPCVCKGCGKSVTNEDFAYVDRDEEHVWCDACDRGERIRHIANVCEVWGR